MKRPIYRIEAIRFKRTQNSEWETGLLFNEGDLNIIDSQSEIVTECWDYHRTNDLNMDLTHAFGNEHAEYENNKYGPSDEN